MISPHPCSITYRSRPVATEKPKRRKPADTPASKSIKTSLTVATDLHARWSAAASLRGISNNAFAVEVLTDALRGLLLIDRRKSSGDADSASDKDRED